MTPNPVLGPEAIQQEIIRLSGLAALLAPGLLRRALADVGAQTPPTPNDFLRALPQIESRMRAYLPPEEVAERTSKIRRLLGG